MSDERSLFSYEPFTRHAFYTNVNRALVGLAVDRLPGSPISVVDLGCGTGALTEMVAEALLRRGIDAAITGIEPSAEALAVAEERLAGSSVRLIQGDAGDLAGVEPVDAVFFCNAIHLVADKESVIGDIAAALGPGGLLAVNSAFSAAAYVPGTEGFYRLWTARAVRWLRREHPGVRLSRGGSPPMAWLAPEEYADILLRHGFEVVHNSLDEVLMTLQSFQDIGHYWSFIEGALPGAPLAAGAEALGRGAAEAFEQLELTAVPRNWLQLVARKG
ncbi:MAG: methyltransferase [Actinomycetota bacterium]|nr:methyltransferase [Actinomycetota bacterium]